MKPLAVVNYLGNNKRAVIALIIAVALGVFLIYTLQALFAGVFSIKRQANLMPLCYFSRVSFRDHRLHYGVMQKIKEHQSTDQIMWAWTHPLTVFNHLGGSGQGTIYFLWKEQLKELLARLNLQLTAGRLPLSCGELVMNQKVFNNLGWQWSNKLIKIGHLGSLPLKLTGVVEGNSALALGKLDVAIMKANRHFRREMLVFHKPGNRQKSNQFLTSLAGDQVAVTTYQQKKKQFATENKELKLVLNIVMLMVIVVLIITVANTSYIHYHQRQEEFGILYALGYTRLELITKIGREVLVVIGLGFSLGLGLSLLFITLLNQLSFAETGFPISIWSLKGFIRAVTVPLFVLGFSAGPLARLIKDLDVINLLERRN